VTVDVVEVSSVACDLGESPLWDHRASVVYWIDAWQCRVHAYVPATRASRHHDFETHLSGRPIGSIGLHARGGLIASVRGGFHHLDLDRGTAHALAAAEADRPPSNRLNDGKCDRAGRFWSASVNTDHKTSSAALWCIEEGRQPTLKQDGLVVGNGIAFSPDDRFFYLADTFRSVVWRYDFDLSSGAIENQRVFTTIASADGFVDGATVDADGCYWAALFRGKAIARFDPDGRLMQKIDLPITCPTMCTFGGPDLDCLFVTSATRFSTPAIREAEPQAGFLFAVHGLGVRGLPEPQFAAPGAGPRPGGKSPSDGKPLHPQN
jgi:sugar lactone lactonase YvrE